MKTGHGLTSMTRYFGAVFLPPTVRPKPPSPPPGFPSLESLPTQHLHSRNVSDHKVKTFLPDKSQLLRAFAR